LSITQKANSSISLQQCCFESTEQIAETLRQNTHTLFGL
ncbi:hypothetical protein ACZ87_03247, partial [Candidatus Erwinia dacicola]